MTDLTDRALSDSPSSTSSPSPVDDRGYLEVDVVVATRDRPELLRQSIDAILAQDYPGVVRVVDQLTVAATNTPAPVVPGTPPATVPSGTIIVTPPPSTTAPKPRELPVTKATRPSATGMQRSSHSAEHMRPAPAPCG